MNVELRCKDTAAKASTGWHSCDLTLKVGAG